LEAAETSQLRALTMWVPTGKEDGVDFDFKKKLTSAIRRIAPNGQSNEIAVSMNVRTLRHTIMMRTSRFAEWEIRAVFGDIYRICKEKWPLMFADAKERKHEGLLEVYGMKMNPFERELEDFTREEMVTEIQRRILDGDETMRSQMAKALVACDRIDEQDDKAISKLGEMERIAEEAKTKES